MYVRHKEFWKMCLLRKYHSLCGDAVYYAARLLTNSRTLLACTSPSPTTLPPHIYPYLLVTNMFLEIQELFVGVRSKNSFLLDASQLAFKYRCHWQVLTPSCTSKLMLDPVSSTCDGWGGFISVRIVTKLTETTGGMPNVHTSYSSNIISHIVMRM